MKAPSSAPSAPSHRIFHHPVIPAAQASYRPLNLPLRRHGPSDDVEPSPPKKPRPDCSDAQKAAYTNNISNRGTAAKMGRQRPKRRTPDIPSFLRLPQPPLLHRISRLVPHRPQIYLSAPPWTLGKRQARRRRIIGSSRQEPMSRSREEVCV